VSHPDIDRLIRSLGGTLDTDGEAALKQHLEQCVACRLEYRKLALLMGTGDPAAAKPRAAGTRAAAILPALRNRMREWQSMRADAAQRDEIKRRVVAEIRPFLGERGASQLLESVSDDGRDLLATLEPVLARFLGDRAGRDLVNRIVDSALLIKSDL
jgi:anti-sigma factor RsiW